MHYSWKTFTFIHVFSRCTIEEEEFPLTPDTHHHYKYQNLSSIVINEDGNSPQNTLQIISQLLYVRLWE